MNDLDDIRRAIDDEIYANGKILAPSDGVRRAIGRRRVVQRFTVAGSAALVAAAAVTAVTVLSTQDRPGPITAATRTSSTSTTSTGTTAATTSSSPSYTTSSSSPATSDTATADPTPSADVQTGKALPTGGLDQMFAAVQWNETYGALVVADIATGEVEHTYTTGIKNPSYDVLRLGTEAYFVATTDDHGCATGWSGIDLLSGNPTAAPAFLNGRPIEAAAIAPNGSILVSEGNCTAEHQVVASNGDATKGFESVVGRAGAKESIRHLAWNGTDFAYAVVVDGGASRIVVDDNPFGNDAAFSLPTTITLPDGCLPTALAYPASGVVAALSCIEGQKVTGTIVRYDASNALVMRKDITTPFKEATVSDLVVQPDGEIFYVVNYEGLESDLFRLETGKDASLAKNLFHIAGQP